MLACVCGETGGKFNGVFANRTKNRDKYNASTYYI